MIDASSRASELLENNTKIEIFSEVLMDIEVNGYSDYTVTFPDSVESKMFPAEEVLKPRRPLGGLPKLITPYGSFQSTEISDLCYRKSKNWYRLPSKDSSYKYYRGKKTSSEASPFSFSEPQEFIIEYSETIRLNKIVVGFEYANDVPAEAEVFLYNNSWVSIGTYSVPSDGLLVLSYDESWSRSDKYSYDFTTTDKIKIVVDSMKTKQASIEIIQISPRISVDITDRIISTSSNKSSSDVNLVSPIGRSSSNSVSIEASNNDGFFDNDNVNSAVYGLIDVNVKFTVKDLIGGDGQPLEKLPNIVGYANSWNFSSDGTVSVDCSDKSKFLQSRAIDNSFYSGKDIRFVIADILERSEIVDYELCFTQEDVDNSAKYFYFQDDKTVWECLQEIATAEQAFFYFDENERFVWVSRDYWWSSTEVDYEIISRSDGNKLPNMQSYSIDYTTVVNKVTVSYSPADLLKRGDKYVNNFLWEQSETMVLLASPLLSSINQNSQYFLIKPEDYQFFPDEGIVNIDAEHIKYSKKKRKITEDNEEIESTLNELIYDVEYAVVDAALIAGVDESEVEILYIQKVVWPDTSIGCPEDFRSYSNILVDGFFIILKIQGSGEGQDILQYNASYTRKPFLCAVLQSDSEEEYSHWKILDDGEEPYVVFNDASNIFVPPNALYIDERGLFNSSATDHYFGVDGSEFTTTYNNTPPEIVNESPRIVYDTIENSKLKLRTNTINPELIHHYSPNRPGAYDIYGAEFVFPIYTDNETIRYDGQGIAGFFINKNEIKSGYYIEFTNTEYARAASADKKEVVIWKYNDSGERVIMVGYIPEDLYLLDLEELVDVSGRPVDILPSINHKVTVFVENIEELIPDGEDFSIEPGVRIVVSVNGKRVLAVDDINSSNNSIYTEGDWGVFARSNTAVDFEYIYAINRNEDTTLLDKSKFAIRDQVAGGFVDNTLEYFLDENNGLRNDLFFEDFGSWVRQVVEVDVEHEIVPSAASNIFVSNESNVYFIYKNLDQFSSKFAIGNRTRGFVVVSGDDPASGSNMTLSSYGVPLNQSESRNIVRINDKSVWRRGEEEIIVESPWIQTEQKAQRIADWTVRRWSQPSESLNVDVIVDPRVQIGDLVTVSIPENSINPSTHKFHVVSINKTIGSTNSMSVRLRRAYF